MARQGGAARALTGLRSLQHGAVVEAGIAWSAWKSPSRREPRARALGEAAGARDSPMAQLPVRHSVETSVRENQDLTPRYIRARPQARGADHGSGMPGLCKGRKGAGHITDVPQTALILSSRRWRPDRTARGACAIDFNEIFSRFDTLLIGRRTFEAMLTMGDGGGSWPGVRSFVISRTVKPADHPDVTIAKDAGALVTELKAEPGKDIWLFGGGELFRSLLDAGLGPRTPSSTSSTA
jgi:hypothetical protein